MKEMNFSYWNATTAGKEEDYDKLAKLELKLHTIYSDSIKFSQLKEIKNSNQIKNPLLQKQLELLYKTYLANQIKPELLQKTVEKSTAAEKKLMFSAERWTEKELKIMKY